MVQTLLLLCIFFAYTRSQIYYRYIATNDVQAMKCSQKLLTPCKIPKELYSEHVEFSRYLPLVCSSSHGKTLICNYIHLIHKAHQPSGIPGQKQQDITNYIANMLNTNYISTLIFVTNPYKPQSSVNIITMN